MHGKGVAAVTSATWVQLTVEGTIYNVWVPGKEVKTPFFLPKKKKTMHVQCFLIFMTTSLVLHKGSFTDFNNNNFRFYSI